MFDVVDSLDSLVGNESLGFNFRFLGCSSTGGGCVSVGSNGFSSTGASGGGTAGSVGAGDT